MQVTRAAELAVNQSNLDDIVYLKEESLPNAEDLQNQVALIPEPEEDGEVVEADFQVGEPGVKSEKETAKMRAIILRRRHLCMEKAAHSCRLQEASHATSTSATRVRSRRRLTKSRRSTPSK